MKARRIDRVGALIQAELGRLILMKLKDPRLGFVTVTHVDITPDLKSARVFYSVLGNEKVKKDSQLALEHASGFLQKEIAMVLKLRYTPKLRFLFDDSIDRGLEIDRVLHDIEKKEKEKSL